MSASQKLEQGKTAKEKRWASPSRKQGGPEKSYFYNDSSLNNLKVRGRPLLFFFFFFIVATGECSPLIYHSSKQRNREPSLNSLSSLRLVFRDFLFDSDLFQ